MASTNSAIPAEVVWLLITPMFPDGTLDFAAYKTDHWHVDQGTDGIVVVGTSGESPRSIWTSTQLIRVAVDTPLAVCRWWPVSVATRRKRSSYPGTPLKWRRCRAVWCRTTANPLRRPVPAFQGRGRGGRTAFVAVTYLVALLLTWQRHGGAPFSSA